MGRHRSDDDSENDRKSRKKKKRRARSRSRSSDDSDSSKYSRSSAKVKKSKKKNRKSSRSRTRSPDRRRGETRSRRSSPRSGDRYATSRRRSHSRSPDYRSRRRSRSRSRSPDRRQSPPSYSRTRRSRSRGRRSRSYSRERRSRSRDRRSRSRSNGRTSSRRLSPEQGSNVSSERKQLKSEDVEERLRLALKAAALADEQLRQVASTEVNPALSVLDRTDFANSVAEIESDSFVSSTFSSSRINKVKEEPDIRANHDDAIFGSLSVTGFTLKPDPDMRPVDLNADSIMHPSLYCDPEEQMDKWIQRLTQLRRRKLEGDAM